MLGCIFRRMSTVMSLAQALAGRRVESTVLAKELLAHDLRNSRNAGAQHRRNLLIASVGTIYPAFYTLPRRRPSPGPFRKRGYFLPVGLSSERFRFFFSPSLARSAHPLRLVSAGESGRGCRAAMLISPAHPLHLGDARVQRVRPVGVSLRQRSLRWGEAEPRRGPLGLFSISKRHESGSGSDCKICRSVRAATARLLRSPAAAAVPGGRTRRSGDPSSCARLHRWRHGLLTV